MADPFANSTNLTPPATHAVAIVPSDSVELAIIPRAIYVGVGGTIKMTLMDDGTAVLFVGVVSGSILDVRPKLVWSTGTVTAASMLGLY